MNQNVNDSNQIKEDSSPKPISFGDDDSNKNMNGQHYRACRTTTEFASHFNFTPQSLKRSLSNSSSKSSFGYSSGSPHMHSPKYPQQIITLELDDYPKEKASSSLLQTIPIIPSIPQQSSLNYEYYNEFTSYKVENKNCKQVLNELSLILANYSPDTDITIDHKQNIISGVVFISNYAVFYTIYIWSDHNNNDNQTTLSTVSPCTRFEFRRQSGDSLAAAKFLGEIKSIFFGNKLNEDDDDNELNLVSFDLEANLDIDSLFSDMNDDEKMEMDIDSLYNEDDDDTAADDNSDLDELYDSLIRNEMISVDELNFLYEKLCDDDDNDVAVVMNDIMDHEKLIKMMINESLQHSDICVVRACLLILEKLCDDTKISLLLNKKYKLLNNIIHLLNHQSSLINKYCIRLLSKIALSENQLNLNKSVYENSIKLLKIHETNWKNSIMNNNGCIHQNMFNNISVMLQNRNID